MNAQPNLGKKLRSIFFRNGTELIDSLTYRELHEKVIGLANVLKKQGLTGKNVLICNPPGLDFIVGFFACVLAGAVAVPCTVPFNNSAAERLNLIIKDAKIEFALTDSTTYQMLQRLKLVNLLSRWSITKPIHRFLYRFHQNLVVENHNLKWIFTDKIPMESKLAFALDHNLEKTLFIQYTSGSTNHPKGVVVTEKNLKVNLHHLSLIYSDHVTPNDEVVTWLPPYHDMGLIGNIIAPLTYGVTLHVISPLDFIKRPVIWLEMIKKARTPTLLAPNFALELLCNKVLDEQIGDLSFIKLIGLSAEPVREITLAKFLKKFGPDGISSKVIFPCYGLAEATLVVTAKNSYSEDPKILTISSEDYNKGIITILPYETELPKIHLVSAGRTRGDTVCVIADTESNQECPPGKIGEICCSGDTIAKGYYNKPKETEETFHYRLPGYDRNFLRTGDLGFIWEDELFVCGRKKDLIIINARNFYPQDIEMIVEHSHPQIRPGCVIAISCEGLTEEELVIVAELKQDNSTKEIRNIIKQEIARQLQVAPKEIVFIKKGTLFKTSSGKLQRQKTKRAYLDNTLERLKE